MDLSTASAVLRLLADPTRVRLLALLDREELTVAELAAVLHLAQPRVSTHLAKLKEAELVRDRRAGVSAYYRANAEADPTLVALVATLRDTLSDALLREDAERLPAVLAQRASNEGWADTVAGDMERHYSPGRTWETLARSLLQLLETGDVLDIASGDGVTAELLAPHAHSILCIDSSDRVVEAARQRVASFKNVEVRQGDMHALDVGDRRFDLVLMMHALTYAERPAEVFGQVAGVLKPGGRVLAVTLGEHDHRAVVEPFDHRNLGFGCDALGDMARAAGLDVVSCDRLSRERRAPHFEVISLLARKP
ncbi:metalloregulator ArsR/SmtB family transcription factor [Bacillus sp. NP157]|nr:metalloregulator ArsR/SmtB family transcription factor [Bacillus sp. NP157]